MATAEPSPSPNPNALKFDLDVRLAETISFRSADEASGAGNAFAAAVLAADGVASLFGVNDFVTVTRAAGAPWEPIIAAVQAVAAQHL